MLDAALKYLVDLAGKAKTASPIDLKDPTRIGYVIDGVIEVNSVPFPPRSHTVKGLDEIVMLADRFADSDSESMPVVWFDDHAVILTIDDGGHRLNSVAMPLETSDVFAKLIELRKNPRPYEQKDFIRLLRVDLAGTLDAVLLLAKCRKLKFTSSGEVTSIKKTQSESLGKEIRSQVETDGGDLPEEVTLFAPVHKTFGLRKPVPIKCAVEVFPADGTFKLVPMPDEIEKAQQEAMQRIAERLREVLPDNVRAYYGKP